MGGYDEDEIEQTPGSRPLIDMVDVLVSNSSSR